MEKSRGTLSVVIPAHNSGSTLERVIEPLSSELTEGDELIVADDGSTDGTPELARSLGARVVTNSGRRGAAGARNSGARAAGGEWLLFVDSDAVAPRGWRGKLSDAVSTGPDAVQAVYGPEAVGRSAATFYKNYYYHYTFTRRMKQRLITGCGTFFFAVRRSGFLELGGFDDHIPGAAVEDADFAARLTGAGGSILLARDIEVLHLRSYTFGELMRYEWNMMRAKVLYMLRRGDGHGVPSVSMARPAEMIPVMTGAAGVWLIPAGLAALAAGLTPGGWIAAFGLAAVSAGHGGFWLRCVKLGGWRGFRAALISFPDLALILPAALAASARYLAGRKY